jgi:hypothetical protein
VSFGRLPALAQAPLDGFLRSIADRILLPWGTHREAIKMSVKKEAERRTASTLTNSTKNVEDIERPKYPPPPRSGNAFAAAVFAAIAGLLLLMASFRVVRGIRHMLAGEAAPAVPFLVGKWRTFGSGHLSQRMRG